jgi:hypothetical protein
MNEQYELTLKLWEKYGNVKTLAFILDLTDAGVRHRLKKLGITCTKRRKNMKEYVVVLTNDERYYLGEVIDWETKFANEKDANIFVKQINDVVERVKELEDFIKSYGID